MPVRTSGAVGPSEVLAVVDGEIEMVKGVMCGTIDHLFQWVTGDHVRVVDEDGPEVDAEEQAEVELAVEGEHEDEEVVGYGLEVAVKRVESMRGEGGRDWIYGVSTMQTVPYAGFRNALNHLWWGLCNHL